MHHPHFHFHVSPSQNAVQRPYLPYSEPSYTHQPHSPVRLQPYTRYLRQLDDSPPFDPSYSPCTYRNQAQNYQQRFQQQNYPNYQGAQYQNYHQTSNANDYYPPYWNQHGTGQFQSCQFAGVNTNYSQSYNNQQHAYSTNQGYGHYPYTNSTNYQHQYQPHQFYPDINPIIPPNDHSFRPPSTCPLNTLTQFAKEPEKYVPRLRKNNNRSIQSSNDLLKQAWDLAMQATEPQDRQEEIDVPEVKFPFEVSKEANSLVDAYEQFVEKNSLKDELLDCIDHGTTTVVPIVDADSRSDTASPGIPILQAAEMAELLDTKEAHRPDPMKFLKFDSDKKQNEEIDDITQNVMKAAEDASVGAVISSRISALTSSPRSKISTRSSPRKTDRQLSAPDSEEPGPSSAHNSLCKSEVVSETPTTPERKSTRSTPVGSPGGDSEEMGFSATRRGRYKKTVTLPAWYKSPERKAVEERSIASTTETTLAEAASVLNGHNNETRQEIEGTPEENSQKTETESVETPEKVKVYATVEDLLKNLPTNVTRQENAKVPVIRLKKSKSPKRKSKSAASTPAKKLRRLSEDTSQDYLWEPLVSPLAVKADEERGDTSQETVIYDWEKEPDSFIKEMQENKAHKFTEAEEEEKIDDKFELVQNEDTAEKSNEVENDESKKPAEAEEKVKNPGKEEEQEMEEMVENPKPNPVLLSLIERMQQRIPATSTSEPPEIEESSGDTSQEMSEEMWEEEMAELLLEDSSSGSSSSSDEMDESFEDAAESCLATEQDDAVLAGTSMKVVDDAAETEKKDGEMDKTVSTPTSEKPERETAAEVDTAEPNISSEVPTTPKVTDPSPRKTKRRSLEVRLGTPIDDDPFSRENLFMKMEKFYEDLKAEVNASEEWKVKQKAKSETQETDVAMGEPDAPSNSKVCDSAPKTDLVSFEKTTTDKKSAFVSTELDSFLTMSAALKNHFLKTDEKLNPKDKPEKYYPRGPEVQSTCDEVRPDIDMIDSMLFLAFGSEETLGTHTSLEMDHDLKAKHVDVFQRFRYLHRPEAAEKGDAYLRSVRKKVKRYEKTLQKEAKKVTKSKQIVDQSIEPSKVLLQKTSDPTKVKGWKGKFGFISNIGGVDVYRYHNGQVHWRTENRLMKTLSPTRVRNLGLALKRRRRRSPILSHKKNKGKSPSASEQIRAWKSKIKPKPKTIPKPGESLSNRPRLWVNDALDDDDIPNVDEVDKILKFAIQDFQDRQPSRKVPRVSTSHLKCQVLSSDKARAAVRTLKVLSQGPHGPELVGSEDECDKPGCRYGCVCHLCGPDESTEETKAKSECEKEYCRLGCICASLNASAKPRNSCHHKTTRCRFRCKCKEDDFKPDLSLPRLRDKRRPSMMASKFKDMISWDRLHGSGVEKNPRRRERDRTRKPVPQVTLPPPPERLKMIPEESVPQYTVYTPDPEYRPPRAKPSTKARGPASTDPAAQAKSEDERKRKKKLQRVINKGAKTKQSVEAYRALTGRKKSQPGRREEEEEEVEDDGPSSCMRTSLYTAKHMRCRCQQETFYTNCQSLRCLHIQLRENLRTKRQGVAPKPLSEQVAENERGILQARNRLRMEEYARKVREAQEAADKTAAKAPKTATEPPKKSAWTTQMMLLQPKRKQEEAGTCRPQLLEIKSCCQWEAIRLQILGYVAQKLKSHDYPPVSRVAIGQFIVEILPKCDKPTKIPPHLRSALPELMFAIRIAIKPIVTASDVMGVHRPDFSHLGKLSQEEDDKKSDDLGVQEDKKSEKSDDLVPRRISTGSRVSMDSRASTPRADNIFEAMSCDSDDCQIVEKSEKSPRKVMEIDLTAEDDPEPEVKMEVEDKKPDVLPEVKVESVEDPDAELDTFMREVNPHTIDTKNFPELPVLVRQAMTNKLWSLIANSVEEAREFQILSKIKHARFPETQVFLQVVCTREEYENECQQTTLPDNDVQCEIVEMVPKERKILFVKTEALEKKTIEPMETKNIEPVEKKPSVELKPEIKTASSRRKSPVVAKDEMPELVREDHDEKPSVPSESSATPILSTILTSPPDISPPPVLQHKDSPYNPAAETHQTSSKRSRRKEKLETRTMKDELEVVPIADLKKPKKIVKAEPDIVEVPMYEPRDRVHPSLAKLMVPGHRWTRMDRVDTNGMVDVEMTPEEVRVKREVVYLEEVRPEEDDLDQIIDILALDEDDPLDAPPAGAGGNDTTLPILDGVKNVRERYRRKMMALSMNHLREQVYEKDDPLRRQKMSRSKVASVVDAISLIKELKEAEMKLMVYKEKSLRRLMGYISVKMAKEGKSLPAQEELKRLAVTRLGRKFLEAPSSVLSFERYCDKYACQDHPIERILRNEQRVMERLTHDWEEKRRLDNTKLVKGEQSPVYELLCLGNGDQVDAAYPGLIVHKDIPRREMRPEEKQYYMSRSKQICDTMKGQMRSLLPPGVMMKENGDGSTVTVSRTFTKLEPKLATATSGPGSPKAVRTASPRILSGSASSSGSGGSLIVKSIRPPAANVVLGGLGALSTPVTSDTSTQVVNVIAKPASSSAEVHVVRRGNSPANNFGLASLRPVATATTTGLSAVTSTAQTGPGTRLVTTAAIRPGDGKSHTTTNLTFVVPNKQVRGAPSQSKSETAPGLLKNTLVFRTPAPGKNVTFVNSVNTAPAGATMLKPARVTGPASGMNMNNVLLVPDKSVPNSGLMFVPLTEKQVQSNNKSILVPVNLVKSGSALPGVKRPNSPAVSDIPAKIQRTVPQTITQTLAHYKRPNSPASAAENTGNKNMAAATGSTARSTETTSMTLSVGAGVDFLNLNPTGPKIIAVSSRDSGKVNGESGAQ